MKITVDPPPTDLALPMPKISGPASSSQPLRGPGKSPATTPDVSPLERMRKLLLGPSNENLSATNEQRIPEAPDGPMGGTRQEPNLGVSKGHQDKQQKFPGQRRLLSVPSSGVTDDEGDVASITHPQTGRSVAKGRPRNPQIWDNLSNSRVEPQKDRRRKDTLRKTFQYRLGNAMGFKDYKQFKERYALELEPPSARDRTKRWNVDLMLEDAKDKNVEVPPDFRNLYALRTPRNQGNRCKIALFPNARG
ncbi:hypothetical protein H0H93_014870 [Arthromyces matolae]|nr:hypothetical protein H0H93_014870 [Arthromyces matolae]